MLVGHLWGAEAWRRCANWPKKFFGASFLADVEEHIAQTVAGATPAQCWTTASVMPVCVVSAVDPAPLQPWDETVLQLYGVDVHSLMARVSAVVQDLLRATPRVQLTDIGVFEHHTHTHGQLQKHLGVTFVLFHDLLRRGVVEGRARIRL